jgi:hypothetical protein
MKSHALGSLLLIPFLGLVCGTSSAWKAKDRFPKVITNAKYVYVTTYYGKDYDSIRMPPEDLRAMNDLEEALRKWGRYIVSIRPEGADLILRVHKGGTSAKAGERVHVGSAGSGTEPIVQGYIGSPQDTLEVYDARRGTDTSPLWRHNQLHGLDAPDIPLLEQLRKDVEASDKSP